MTAPQTLHTGCGAVMDSLARLTTRCQAAGR